MKLNILVSVCAACSALVAMGASNVLAEGGTTSPIIVPHRGMWDEKVPQNTVEAIRRAYAAGALCVETDFHHTRHGQIVCMHARKELERYTGCRKQVADLTPQDIQTLNLGEKQGLSRVYRIPLLDEVLAVVPKDRVLQAEIKGYSKEYPDLFVAAVKKAGLSEANITVSSFSYDALKDFKARYPEFRTIHLVQLPKDKEFSAKYWIDRCKQANIDVFCPGCVSTVGVMTRADADAIRASGLDFRVFGVKSLAAMRQAAMLGASGFTCDFWNDAFKWVKELGVDYRLVTMAEPAKMKAIYTVPHEFDMLVRSGHIQGLACSEKGIYLSHQDGLAKIGWDGKLIKHIETPRHLGGIACADGRIYGAFIIRRQADMQDGKPGLVRVWDEDLNLVAEKSFRKAFGSVGVLGDTVYCAIEAAKRPHRECHVKRLGLDLEDRGNQTFDFGYEIRYGIQAIASDGKSLICANYGGVSLANPEFTEFKTLNSPKLSEGFALVPKSVSKREKPVFMVVRALGGNMQGWRKDPKNNPPRLRLEFYEFDGKNFTDITEEPAMSDEDGAVVSAKKSRNAQKSGALDFSGSLPGSIRTVALVMPASIQSKDRFDSGKAALEAAGYKVKVMPRLDFEKVAPVADRVADFEQAWMDPEVDLVLCARGGRGAEDLLDKIDWAKLRTRNQRVLGFSNITMLLNAMLKEQAGRPYSGPTLSQFVYAKRPTFDWLSKALADNAPMPDVKLRALRPGACSGLACGGHITLVLKGVEMGWAADAKDRIVFLETSIREPAVTRAELDRLVASGYFKDCAGVVFGDMAAGGPNRTRLSGKALAAGTAEMARIRRDFAAKMTCPVYENYPYGHVSISYAIDFLRKKTITADGILKQ